MIKKIYAVWIYVSDLKKSRKFYEKSIGLKVKLVDGPWIEYDLGDTSFAIHNRSKVTAQKTRVMFEVDDIEKMKKKLLSNKVKLIGAIRAESYGKLLTFEDPDGHWLELFEPR